MPMTRTISLKRNLPGDIGAQSPPSILADHAIAATFADTERTRRDEIRQNARKWLACLASSLGLDISGETVESVSWPMLASP